MQIAQRMATTVGVLSFILAGLVGGVAVPTMLSMKSLKKDIAENQAKIEERFASQRYVRNAMSSFQGIITKVGTLSTTAVREGEELELITAIESAADVRRVTQNISLETANQKDLSPWERQIPIHINAEGSFPNAVRFLADIERLPYLMTVSSVKFSSSKEAVDGNVNIAIDGTVYWQSAAVPEYVKGIYTEATP